MLPPAITYKGEGISRGCFSAADDEVALFAQSNKGPITDNLVLDWLHRFNT